MMITADTKMVAVVTYGDYDHDIQRVVLCAPDEVRTVLTSERIKATWLGYGEIDTQAEIEAAREEGETDADVVDRIYGEWQYASHPTIVDVAKEPIAVTPALQSLNTQVEAAPVPFPVQSVIFESVTALAAPERNPLGLDLAGHGETLRVEGCDNDLINYLNTWYDEDDQIDNETLAFISIEHYFGLREEYGGDIPAVAESCFDPDDMTESERAAEQGVIDMETGIKMLMDEAKAKGASYLVFRAS